MTQEQIKQAYRLAVGNGTLDVTTTYAEFEKLYASNNTAIQKFHKIYTESIINGKLDPAETTIDEFIKIANILFENMDDSTIYKGSVDDSAIKQQLLKAIESLSEDNKEDAIFNVDKGEWFYALESFKDNRVVVNQVISYLEQQNDFKSKLQLAKCYKEYIGNKTKVIEALQNAEHNIKTFSDVQDLCEEVKNIEDPKWIEQIIKTNKTLINNVSESTMATELLMENTSNTILAKEILTIGLSRVENLEDMIEIIQCVNDDLKDKEWSSLLLKDAKEYLKTSQDYSSIITALTDPYDVFIYSLEAINLMKTQEDGEALSFSLSMYTIVDKNPTLQDIEELCESDIDTLKSKYKKPTPEELKNKYGQALANGTISAQTVSYQDYEANYWKYQTEIEVPVTGKPAETKEQKNNTNTVENKFQDWLDEYTEPLTQDYAVIAIKSNFDGNELPEELATLENLKCINAADTEIDDFNNILYSETIEFIQLPEGYSDDYMNGNFVFGYNKKLEPMYVNKNSNIKILIPCYQLEGYGAYASVGYISGKDFYKVLTDPSVDVLYELDSFELVEVGQEMSFETKSACNGEVIFSYRGERPRFTVPEFSEDF